MLRDCTPMPTLATSDLGRARAFYEGTLGFVADEDVPEGVAYAAGSTRFLVYPSAFAGSNKATSMGFQVDAGSFDTEIADLQARGVQFDTFEAPGLTWQDGVGHFDGMRAVWFHDPDGNILAVETAA